MQVIRVYLITALFVLAIPLVFLGNAGAYYGGENCIDCHGPGDRHNPNGDYSLLDPTMTGHWTMQRILDGTADGGILNPAGNPYPQDLSSYILAYDGWLGYTTSGEAVTVRTVAAGGSYTCASCHCTGYVSDKSRHEPAATLGVTETASFTGSWNDFGIKCERCHGEDAIMGGYGIDQGGLDETCADVCGAGYVGYRYRNPGDGDPTCSGERITYLGCSNDGGATLYDPADPTCTTTFPAYTGECTGHSAPGTDDGHHIDRREDIFDTEDPAVGAIRTALCIECHSGSHEPGFLNSPHARFSGDPSDNAQIADPANYDTHFATSSHEYGGCSVCHNIHQSLAVAGAEPFHESCGIDCHNPESSHTPDDGMAGFHDYLGDPDAPDTEGGTNPDACDACHLPEGLHLFRNNTSASYSYELDPDDADDNALCVAQGGHWGSSHGATVCMDASGAHMGRFAPEGDFAEAQWNDLSMVCLGCHNGTDAVEFTNLKALESGLSGGYHQDGAVNFANPCTDCHADKGCFCQTGHSNMLRVLDGTATGGICNPDGDPYPQDLTGLILAYDGWLGYESNPDVTVRTVGDGGSYTCGECHTTGFTANCSDPTKTSQSACEGAGETWAPDPTKQPSTIAAFTDISGISGSWDKPGVQCERCHGSNTATHHNASAASEVAVNALCGECHSGTHSNGMLNSPHARFTGTWGELGDDTKYDSHFTHRDGCAGCHYVHESKVVAGAEPFNSKCGVGCHGVGTTHGPVGIWHPGGVGTPLENGQDESCAVCHMEGSGNHLFRINTDASYCYEIDATTPEGEAECVAQGGHVASSHGALVCLDANGIHMGRIAPEGDFTCAQWVDIDQACGQCHGGGNNSTDNPPKEGVTYINKVGLASLAQNMHDSDWVPTYADLTVKVRTYNDTPIEGAKVKLYKKKSTGWVLIKKGKTDASGSKTFNALRTNKKYKVIVIKRTVDFNGAVADKQKKVKFGDTVPKTSPVKLTSDTTINVMQGIPATNGPTGEEWKGDNGSPPTITITTP